MLPLSLLNVATGSPLLVELKGGDTYNGRLVSCDSWMNMNLSEVICTSKDGDRFWKLPSCYIRGSAIKYLRLPPDLLEKARLEGADDERNGRGGGAGRGGRVGGRGRGPGRSHTTTTTTYGGGRGRGREGGRGRGREDGRGRGREGGGGRGADGGRGRGGGRSGGGRGGRGRGGDGQRGRGREGRSS